MSECHGYAYFRRFMPCTVCAPVSPHSSLLEEHGVINHDSLRHITACVVVGLEVLHQGGILYRALSPELVFLDSR